MQATTQLAALCTCAVLMTLGLSTAANLCAEGEAKTLALVGKGGCRGPEGSMIYSHSYLSLAGYAQCAAACIADADCTGVEYFKSRKRSNCQLQNKDIARSSPPNAKQSGVSCYKATCTTAAGEAGEASKASGTVTVTPQAGASAYTAQLGAYPGFSGRSPSGKMVLTPGDGKKLGYDVHVEGVNPVLKVTMFARYLNYGGNLSDGITGTVYFEQLDDGSLRVNYDLGLNEASATGGLHIHTGTDCSLDAGPHWWNSASGRTRRAHSADPWTTANGATYTTDTQSRAVGSYELASGFAYKDNIGHTVVIHSATGAKIACGVLVDSPGGVHVHTGTSCAEAATVGGHYFGGDATVDPWTTTYSPGGTSSASTQFSVDDGYTFAEHASHAVVVHSGNGGSRIACGVFAPVPAQEGAPALKPETTTAAPATDAQILAAPTVEATCAEGEAKTLALVGKGGCRGPEGSMIYSHSYLSLAGYAQCAAACIADADCTGVEYFKSRKRSNCQLQNKDIARSSRPNAKKSGVSCYKATCTAAAGETGAATTENVPATTTTTTTTTVVA